MPSEINVNYADLDRQYVWHPFTPMRQWLTGEPVVIESGLGFELIDTAGRRYIDGVSSLWCNLHGHRVPQIDQAVRDQLGRIAHSTLLGLGSVPASELAEKLIAIAPAGPPGLTKVFFSDSGAAAVEVALKMAFQYWRIRGQSRRKFIALREGYHGDTIGAVSVGGIDLFHEAFRPLLFETTFVDSPNPFHYSLSHPEFAPGRARDDLDEAVSQEVLDRIDEVLSTGPRQYCAVIVEPLVQAAAGMLTHPRGFLKGLRELTRRRGVLLIADEVATGFARTGTMFACQQEEVCPDLMCLGKGLSGGYLPVSATLTSQEIFEAFCGDGPCGGYGGQTFLHGHTFAGNALGCAAACASIDLIHSSGLLAALPSRIALIRRRLAPLADHPHAGDIRQCGMMAGIDLVADRASGTFFDPGLRVGAGVCRAAIRRGIMIRPLGDVVVLMPAPAMDLPTLDRLVSGVVESIHEHFPGKGV